MMFSSPSDGNLSTRLTELYRELEAIEADKAPAKAGMILAGLGFSPPMQTRATRYDIKHLDISDPHNTEGYEIE